MSHSIISVNVWTTMALSDEILFDISIFDNNPGSQALILLKKENLWTCCFSQNILWPDLVFS